MPGLLHCRWILYHLSYPGSPLHHWDCSNSVKCLVKATTPYVHSTTISDTVLGALMLMSIWFQILLAKSHGLWPPQVSWTPDHLSHLPPWPHTGHILTCTANLSPKLVVFLYSYWIFHSIQDPTLYFSAINSTNLFTNFPHTKNFKLSSYFLQYVAF